MSTTTEKKKFLLFAILSKLLMIGGCVLLCWTINVLHGTTTAFVTLTLALTSLFIYIMGASLLGRKIRYKNFSHSYDDMQNGVLFALLLIAAGALMICFNTELLNQVWK